MDAEELTGRAEVRQHLATLISALKLKQREVVLLRYVHGYTNKETAELCGIPLETARDRLKKGRAALKKKVMADPLLKEWVREWIER
jgi:RNA polymerase sigma-70 factor (ECF subfamily)